MEVNMEVDLCIICCSKIKNDPHGIGKNISNCSLLSSNLIVFYLLRKVLQLNDNELKKNLIGCGNPVEWIRLCDKCTELTGQAEELNRKLMKIERELRCIEQLIWDKTVKSINCEGDRKLVEETIDWKKNTGQVWRRIRNHVANKSNSANRCIPTETFTNPFIEGDKLANYLITRNASTAILQVEELEVNEVEENNDHVHILEETNLERTSPPIVSSINNIEVKAELDPLEEVHEEEPQLPPHSLYHDNLVIDSLLVELEDVKVELDDPDIQKQDICEENGIVSLEEMEVDARGGDRLSNDKDEGKEEDGDWNWEPEDDEENEDENEVDDEEDDSVDLEETEEISGKGASKRNIDKVASPLKKKSGKYVKKGRAGYTRVRTEDGKVKCRDCERTFVSLSGCNSHEREYHSKTPGAFPCDICERVFNSRDYLRKHKQRQHKTNPDGTWKTKKRKIIKREDGKFQCPQCDQIFVTSSGCIGHVRNKHSKTPGAFICDICGRAFNTSAYLRSHKTCSHRVRLDGTPIPKKPPKLERDHICDQCGKGLINARQLKKHVRFVHEKRFDFKCALCGAGWPSRNAMKKHMLAVHADDPLTKKLREEEGLGLWTCPVVGCKVRFLREDGVKGHLKSKHGKSEEEVEGLQLGADAGVVLEDPSMKVTCDRCGKICFNKKALKSHEERHGNEGKARDIFCERCGKGFVSKEGLKYHVNKVHLKKGVRKEKIFKCEICGKAYAQRCLLKGHLEIHEREGRRDIFCDKCGHSFVTELHLRKHRKVTSCGVDGKVSRVYNRKGD